MARGCTNDTASMRDTPVRESPLINATLASVGTGSSFCKPSRGPTSRRLTAVESVIGARLRLFASPVTAARLPRRWIRRLPVHRVVFVGLAGPPVGVLFDEPVQQLLLPFRVGH